MARVSGRAWVTDPNRATAVAFVIALATTTAIAWRVAPMRPNGDEPHYLVATESLLRDGDLEIANNYAQRDYAAYFPLPLSPQYLVRGKNGAIYPVHAPGLSALVMPAFAAAGYPGVVAFLLLALALTSALVWRIAWLATGDAGAAWIGWAMVASSCTWAFQTFLVYPDALGAAALACGLWLILRLDRGEPPPAAAILAVGCAVTLLPWLHTRFVIVALGLGVMCLLRLWPLGARRAALFATVPALGALAWFGFFWVIYGTPNPVAQWGGGGDSQLAWIPSGLGGALFDQQFGLLPYAPVLLFGFAGLVYGTSVGWRRSTRVQIVAFVVLPYLAAATSYAMWWGGSSIPARLLTVLLPVLAPAGAVLWQKSRRPIVRHALLAALGWTIFATASLGFAEHGQLAWNLRQAKAGRWFDWLVSPMRWSQALPAFFRADDRLGREALPLPSFYVVTAIWTAAIASALAGGAWLGRVSARVRASAAHAAVTVTALVLVVPIATVVALRVQGANASRPLHAQLTLLTRVAGGGRWLAIAPAHRRVVSASRAIGDIRMTAPASNDPSTTFFGGPLPAGTYRLRGEPSTVPSAVVIGRGQWPVASLGNDDTDIALPVPAPALIVRGSAGRRVTLQPVSVRPGQLPEMSRSATRYGSVTVHFLDGNVFIEQGGFWIAGTLPASVAVQGDPGERHAQFAIVNGPLKNRVELTVDGRPVVVELAPRTSSVVPFALDDSGAARLQIRSTVSFVPADIDPANVDRRSLGVFVTSRQR